MCERLNILRSCMSKDSALSQFSKFVIRHEILGWKFLSLRNLEAVLSGTGTSVVAVILPCRSHS